jgi:hypothetical protein
MTCIVEKHPWYSILFVLYVSITSFLLLNMVAATTYAVYKTLVLESVKDRILQRSMDLHHAFTILDVKKRGIITLSVIIQLFHELNKYKLVRYVMFCVRFFLCLMFRYVCVRICCVYCEFLCVFFLVFFITEIKLQNKQTC